MNAPTPLLTLCAVSKDQDQSTGYAARDALSRRLTPEVAAKVYAALQANKVLLERIQVERTFSQDAALNATTQALNLLDGKTT